MGSNNKLLLCVLLLALFAISMLSVVSAANKYGPNSLKPAQCSPKCIYRCSKAREHKACLFFCNKCCKKCLCVPPGTNGNKQVCSCYNNWKTQQGGPKCP